jgi:DNA-binding transcriptional MerR regulator
LKIEKTDAEIAMRRLSGKTFTTSQIARAVRCHPNTVRLYEVWGLLMDVSRSKNGYRVYSENHLKQMQLARLALPGPFPGGGDPVYRMVKEAARGHVKRALSLAKHYQHNVREETLKARAVLKELERWARSLKNKNNKPMSYSRRMASLAIGLTIDTLRTWERNGLIVITKNDRGHCIYTQRNFSRLKIIDALSRAGFSLASIYKMLLDYDAGKIKNISAKTLAHILNTPEPDAPIVYVTDMWLSTLDEHRVRAVKIIRKLKMEG